MKPQRYVPLLVGALILTSVAQVLAQQPTAAPPADSVQPYAPPSQTAPVPAPAPTAAPTQAPAPAQAAPAPAPAGAPAPAAAATPAPVAAPQTVAKSLGFIDVIPARQPERIQRQLDIARSNATEADARLATATEARSKTKGMLEVKKQEISTIDARIKLADKSKQETEKITLGAEKKVQERQKAFLERREALHAAEIDGAKASKKLADATTRALELELQLAQKRQTRPQGPAADPAATLNQDQVIRELERKTLELQRQQAQAQKDVADKDEDIAKRRLELYQAQSNVTDTNSK